MVENLSVKPVDRQDSHACFVSESESLESPHETLSNGMVEGKIRLKGAVLDDWALKHYKEETSKDTPVRLLRPYATRHGYWVSAAWEVKEKGIILPDEDTV